ncbi:MAG: T9SS type A sorting domain-containing protein [Candidatus Cloacimonas sp.]|jgi:streptogramin lyase|nr:T9SS type A sorting domain-containing protein [Candidatus Cloacimonas sp.]
MTDLRTIFSGRQIACHRGAICLLIIILAASINLLNADTIYVVNSQSRTLSRIDTATDNVQNVFAQLGNIPNKVVVGEDYLWSVNSGDNAVQKIDRETGAVLANILVANGSNPWDAFLHEGFLYVTGLFTNKVYRINTQTGLVTGSVSVGYAPEALCVVGGKLYICNAGNYAQNYSGSSVSVIDIASFSVLKTISVNANPQYITLHNGLLHISCTGNWTDVAGSITIINPITDTITHTLPLGGTPGSIWINNQNQAYVADSNGVNLYSYHAMDFNITHGADNPLAGGGSEVGGSPTMLAVLVPNWGSSATVKIFRPDLSNWKQYTVGMVPTDMKVAPSSSAIEDALVSQPIKISTYPNPIRAGELLQFSSAKALNGELSLYNLKGQLIAKQHFSGESNALSTSNLDCGCYIYKISTDDDKKGKQAVTGKVIVVH